METVTVVMLVSSGQTEDSKFFDYRPTYFGDIVRIEWEADTNQAVLPRDTADYLIRHNYARLEAPASIEASETTAPSTPPPPSAEPSGTITTEEEPPPPPPPSGKKKEKSK